MSDSMWEVMDSMEAQESGGGAIIGRIEFAVGYKLFVTGMSQEDTFFQFDPLDEKAKNAALEKAKKVNEEHGAPSRPQIVAQFRVFKADVLGREVTWKGDRFFAHPIWTPGYKEVVKPALKEAGIRTPGVYWGRIAFKDDPSGRQEVKQDGTLGAAQVEHLVEVYLNKAAAQAAAGGAAPAAGGTTHAAPSAAPSAALAAPAAVPGVPAGWEKDTWDAVKPEIAADIAKRLGEDKSKGNVAKTLAAVAKDYGVTIGDLQALVVA